MTTIGSHGDNDLVLADPSVSSFHAQITCVNGVYRLKDLNSTNGSTINNDSITEARVKGGDTVAFGSVLCRFQEQIPQPGPTILKPQKPLPGSSKSGGPSGQRGLPEEVGTLKEFYPEPTKRHRVHYEFAHRFLPPYVRQNPYAFFKAVFDTKYPTEAFTIKRFIQSRWMMYEEMAGLIPTRPIGKMIFRSLLDLEISGEKMPYGPVALITMPTPEETAEAIFIGVALLNPSLDPKSWNHHVQARYFVLERTFEGPDKGVLCEWVEESHQNHRLLLPAEPLPFLEGIGRTLRKV